jgi:hypothetical protein
MTAMRTTTSGPRAMTTGEYTPVHDHARLPWRFFARLVGDGRPVG